MFRKILFSIVLIIVFFAGRMLFNSGYFKSISDNHQGKIQEISGMIGAEDITIDQATGLAFISSDDRRNHQKGNIFLLNLNENTPKPINLTANSYLEDFHPHGISLLKLPDGRLQLYVVNHRETTGTHIELFEYSDTTFQHKDSFQNDLFVSPNDVLAVAEKKFYLTNDHDEPLSKMRANKDLLQIPMGNVVFFDGKQAQIVVEGLRYANGINQSLDGKKVFVAETTNQKIRVYDKDMNNGNLKEIDAIKIDGADNIEVMPDGSLWVGCHPKLLAFLGHSKKKEKISPSQILKITYKPDNQSVIEEKYLDSGKQLSGSSVGTIWKNRMLIGTVFEPKVLLIDLTPYPLSR